MATPAIYGLATGTDNAYAVALPAGAAPAAISVGVLFMCRKTPPVSGLLLTLPGDLSLGIDAANNLVVVDGDATTTLIPLGTYLDTWVLLTATQQTGSLAVYLNGMLMETIVVAAALTAPTAFALALDANLDTVVAGGFWSKTAITQAQHEALADSVFATGSLSAARALAQHVYLADRGMRPVALTWSDEGTLADTPLALAVGTTLPLGLVTPGDFLVPGGGAEGPPGPEGPEGPPGPAGPDGPWTMIDYVEGFVADGGTAANRRGYTRGSDPLSATPDFTVVCVFSPNSSAFVDSDPKQVFGTRTQGNGGGGGWSIQMMAVGAFGNARINFEVTQAGASLRDGGADLPTMVGKFIVAHLSVSGTTPSNRLYVNGACVAQSSGGGAGQYDPGGNMCIGVYNEGTTSGGAGQFDGKVHGAAYATSIMTDAEIAAHAAAIQEAGMLVQTPSGTALADGWRADVAGAEPGAATWPSFLGGVALTTLNATALTLATKAPPVTWV